MTAWGTPYSTLVSEDGDWVTDAAFLCDNCHRISVRTQQSNGFDPRRTGRGEPDDEDVYSVQWMPAEGVWQEFNDVPPPIGAAAKEAWFCHANGAHRGALGVARAVLEASAKYLGHEFGNLPSKIDALVQEGKLRPGVAEAAHEIRHLGNEAAHGDLTAAIPPAEVEEVLVLMDDVLVELFQAPARRNRAKANRERRRSGRSEITDAVQPAPPG